MLPTHRHPSMERVCSKDIPKIKQSNSHIDTRDGSLLPHSYIHNLMRTVRENSDNATELKQTQHKETGGRVLRRGPQVVPHKGAGVLS